MVYQRREGGRSGGKKFGDKRGGSAPWKKSFGGDRDGQRPTLYPAICGECGERCQVPFRPNGKKPVLCSNCFVKDGGMPSKRFDDKRSVRSSYDERPSYADRRSADKGHSTDAYEKQLKMINTKLDAIMKALGARSAAEPAADDISF